MYAKVTPTGPRIQLRLAVERKAPRIASSSLRPDVVSEVVFLWFPLYTRWLIELQLTVFLNETTDNQLSPPTSWLPKMKTIRQILKKIYQMLNVVVRSRFYLAKIAQNSTLKSKVFLSHPLATKLRRQLVYIERIAALYLQGKQQQVTF